jgi:hypothetical protein
MNRRSTIWRTWRLAMLVSFALAMAGNYIGRAGD